MDRGAWCATVHGVTESDTTKHTQALREAKVRGQWGQRPVIAFRAGGRPLPLSSTCWDVRVRQRQAASRSSKSCSTQTFGRYLPALMGSSLGPDPGPELRPVSQQHPTRTNCTGPLDLESFCFLFPHISGVGVFSKTQTHLLTKREKKLGEQGACGQRSDPSSPRAMPGSPFLAARAQRVPQAAARDI